MRDARSTAAKEMFFVGLRIARAILLPEAVSQYPLHLVREDTKINPHYPAAPEPSLHCGVCGDELKTLRSRCKCSKARSRKKRS